MQAGGGEVYFGYGETELPVSAEQRQADGEVIDRVGMIRREVDRSIRRRGTPHRGAADLYQGAGHRLAADAGGGAGDCGQRERTGGRTGGLAGAGHQRAQGLHHDFALRVQADLRPGDGAQESSDAEAIRLCTLKGVGVWTAEMILLFCLQRPDIFSYDDLAIQQGLRMVYHHRQVSGRSCLRSIGGTAPVAAWPVSIWAVAGGAVPELRDYAPPGREK